MRRNFEFRPKILPFLHVLFNENRPGVWELKAKANRSRIEGWGTRSERGGYEALWGN